MDAKLFLMFIWEMEKEMEYKSDIMCFEEGGD